MGLVIAVATIAGYGAIWWILGIWAARQGSALGYAVAPLAFAVLVGLARWRMPDEPPERRRQRAQRGKVIGDVTGIQALLISIALFVLLRVDRMDLAAPIIAIIMGLHFLAFARMFPAFAYYATSVLLVGLGVTGFFLGAGNARELIVSIGAASILWLTCVAVLIWPESRRSGV